MTIYKDERFIITYNERIEAFMLMDTQGRTEWNVDVDELKAIMERRKNESIPSND